MKVFSASTHDGPTLAIRLDAGVLLLSNAVEWLQSKNVQSPRTLADLVLREDGLQHFCGQFRSHLQDPALVSLLVPEDHVAHPQLFVPRNILCVGLNYKDHAEESKTPLPQQPVLFAKWVGCASAMNAPIVLPPDTNEVDYEAELAVVIGRTCRSVSAGEALNYVAAYTCLNDVSARDFQRADGQWVRAKSQDTFGPFGPYLVTPDEIQDPQSLGIRCRVNGRMLQDSNTSQMIFSVRELIAYISRGVTLQPGDIISTGTPHGVGFAQKPPVFLQPGDVVEVEIDKIGRLVNSVISMESSEGAA